MLNYEIHMEPREAEVLDAEIKNDLKLANPFPGLRPFGISESHLFFGREGQVDEVLVKLARNRFIAVMGYSGSGKSSMMYSGMIPVLYGGFMTEVGPNWNIIISRPGISPLDNLAEAILENDPDFKDVSEEERLINKTVISSILRGSNRGLIDIVKRFNLATGDNLLIFIDQFEELIRYSEEKSIEESEDESAEFVELLLEASNQKDIPLYIAISMRSDYIGACAQFTGLTQKINQSNYLVPQMNRQQKKMAVVGPVAVGGGTITERLIKKLLTDLGDSQDQLPLMQHALMRTWDYWVDHKDPGEPIDLRHYNAIGKISEALSQHANEAYEELNDKEKHIAEIIFKTITEKGSDNYGLRRPTKIAIIAEIAGVEDQDVINVVEKFREPGRSILMPSANIPLNSESIVEVSHESLMRIWIRLKNWVDEEHESAQMYLRLSEAAAMYQVGRTGLWRPPDLQLALNWQKKQNPTRVWAQRYDEAFERAIVFLDTSRITYEAEQKNQEMQQRRLLKRTRMVAVILAIAAVIAIIFFIFGITQRIATEEQRAIAVERMNQAVRAQQLAEQRQQEAIDAREAAELSAIEAQKARDNASANLERAIQQTEIAKQQQAIALEQKRIADSSRLLAENATQIAQEKAEEARQNFNQAQRLLFLSVAQSMAVKSLQIQDDNLKGLLAQQAYMFNYQYAGRQYDNYIYDGLYYAMSQIMGDSYNKRKGHKDAVRTVAFSPNSSNFYSGGSDGKILKWEFDSDQPGELIYQNDFPNRIIKISPDSKWLVNASDSSYIQLFNLENPGKEPVKIYGHKSFVYDIEFLPDNSGFLSVSDDKTIRFYDFNKSRLVKNLDAKIKTISVSPDSRLVAAGGLDGTVYLLDFKSFNENPLISLSNNIIHSVRFSNSGKYLAIGDESGLVRIWDIENNEIIQELIGHKARINDLEFSQNDRLLASGSWDGSVLLWVMDKLDDLPVSLRENNGHVWDVSFNPNGNYLIAGSGKNIVKIWPTNPGLIAQDVCEYLERNMTEKEWQRYVGNGIDYRITCTSFKVSGK